MKIFALALLLGPLVPAIAQDANPVPLPPPVEVIKSVAAPDAPVVRHPYFRGPWSWASGAAVPQLVTGACIDPLGNGASTQCSALGLITHSANDGYLLVPGEDWYLLGAGYSLLGTSKIAPTLSTGYNILPVLAWAGSAAGLPITIPSISAKGFSLDGSVSPTFVYDPSVPHGGKGYFRILAGGSLHFGR